MVKPDPVRLDYDTAMLYSEWLDSLGLMSQPAEDDKRTHDDLARQFIESYEGDV